MDVTISLADLLVILFFTFSFGFMIGALIYNIYNRHNLNDCKEAVEKARLIESVKDKITPEERKAIELDV
jgi:hypothetical protein